MKIAHNFKDMTGKRFGRLYVLSYTQSINNSARWLCRCDCGSQCEIDGYAMRVGHTKSCGCIHSEQLAERNSKHKGAIRKKRNPAYGIWKAMRRRTTDRNLKYWNSYGGKGVKVCERWQKFENFLADMGERPSPQHSIDRIDNDGDYCPENCRWATHSEQANNRSSNRILTFNGVAQNVASWALALGIPDTALRCRLHAGWSVERTLTTPLLKRA